MFGKENFFEANKIFIAIIIGAIIIAGAIYFSGGQEPKEQVSIPQPPIEESDEIATPDEREEPETDSECISYTKAGSHIGEQGCIYGKVDHVFTSNKGNNFLNFCANYKTCAFSAVIFSSDSSKFSNIKGYGGKEVEITGLIKTYQGRAEIIINDPSQITIK